MHWHHTKRCPARPPSWRVPESAAEPGPAGDLDYTCVFGTNHLGCLHARPRVQRLVHQQLRGAQSCWTAPLAWKAAQ